MSSEDIIRAENLVKHYPVKTGLFSSVFSRNPPVVHAVDGVSFNIKKGEVLGLAGESGSGKSTTGRLLVGLITPTKGRIYFAGKEITGLSSDRMKPLRRRLQIIFQDPYESLNPRMTVKEIVAEPLRVQHVARSERELVERVKAVLRAVELVPPEEFMFRYPHELSGGQRQRVAVARAFALRPAFVVADEPVSMLDVSIRAEILNLILANVQRTGASFLYITHDLTLAKHMCDRLAIMYLGKIVEIGATEEVIERPLHPYTQALLDAVPVADPTSKRIGGVITGEIPSPVYPPPGCRFHTRCPYAFNRCIEEEPPLIEVEPGHFVACHMVDTPIKR